jgi:hypothetical protein
MDTMDVVNIIKEMKQDLDKYFDKIDTRFDKIDERLSKLVTDEQCKERMNCSNNLNSNKIELSAKQSIAAIIGALGMIATSIVAALK